MSKIRYTFLLTMLPAVLIAATVLAGIGTVRHANASFDDPPVNEAACTPLESPPALELHKENEIRSVAQQTLDTYNAHRPKSMPLEIFMIWGEDDWAVAECAFKLEGQPAAGTDGILLLLTYSEGEWQATLPGDTLYSSWLNRIPERYMARAVKEQMLALNVVTPELIDPSDGIYRLPYPNSASVYITQDSNQHGGPIDMWSANGAVVAAMDGWVDGFYDDHWECCCNSQCGACNNWIKLRHSNGEFTEYYHIAQNSVTVGVDEWVSAGTLIATQSDIGWSCGSGRFETGCGSYHDSTYCGTHVHFAVRTSGGVLRKPRICDGSGGWFYPVAGYTYTAQDCPGCCGCLPASCCSGALAQAGNSSSEFRWGDIDLSNTTTSTPCTASATYEAVDITESAALPEVEEELDTTQRTDSWGAELPITTTASMTEPAWVSPEDTDPIDAPAIVSLPAQRAVVEPQRTPPTSTNYRIPKSVFGSGGGAKTSTHYVMNSTQGQSTDLSRRTSTSYVLTPGYWSRWTPINAQLRVYLPLVTRNQ